MVSLVYEPLDMVVESVVFGIFFWSLDPIAMHYSVDTVGLVRRPRCEVKFAKEEGGAGRLLET